MLEISLLQARIANEIVKQILPMAFGFIGVFSRRWLLSLALFFDSNAQRQKLAAN